MQSDKRMTSVVLPESIIEYLKEIGAGNMTTGIMMVVLFYQTYRKGND